MEVKQLAISFIIGTTVAQGFYKVFSKMNRCFFILSKNKQLAISFGIGAPLSE